MKPHFTADFFKGNRQRLLGKLKADSPIILTGNGLLQKNTDVTYPFKQDGSFWYLSGVDEPNVVLVFDGKTSYLVIPQLSSTREAFDGAIDTEKLKHTSGVDEILLAEAGWEKISKLVKASKRVGTLMPADAFIESFGMYTNPARSHLIERLQAITTEVEFVDIRQSVGQLRMVKQPVEVEALQKAIDITIDGINQVETAYKNHEYETEFDIELALTQAFHKNGGSGHSFDAIVAGGSKGATIHPFGQYGKIDYAKSMLLDVGAEFEHYAADISRTWLPKEDKRFAAVYQAVKDVADYAMTIIKPGIKMREYEQDVEARMGEELVGLGLINEPSHEAIRKYFPHATSHFLGIDVHDSGDYEQPLSEGVVMTVEPGIYIPDEGIGVRIEDDVLITKDGCINLSAKLKR